jgi:hypothetical protein
MSSTAELIRRIHDLEVRYPSDLLHNGHQYVPQTQHLSGPLARAIRRLRSRQRIQEMQAVTGWRTIRIHRVAA